MDAFNPTFLTETGAGEEARTLDIFLGKEVLYQLSYARIKMVEVNGIEPMTFSLQSYCSPS